jgi:hypothetical protein
LKCTDLNYLKLRTKSNKVLMMEFISLYLEQTPSLVKIMKQSLLDEEWSSLKSSVHKMVPSFSIVGINPDFEKVAEMVQEYAQQKINGIIGKNEIPDLVLQLEKVLTQSCDELEKEFNLVKTSV